jgi:hypothetical protein
MKNKSLQNTSKSNFFTILPHLKIIAKIKGIKLNKLANYRKIVLLYRIQQN